MPTCGLASVQTRRVAHLPTPRPHPTAAHLLRPTVHELYAAPSMVMSAAAGKPTAPSAAALIWNGCTPTSAPGRVRRVGRTTCPPAMPREVIISRQPSARGTRVCESMSSNTMSALNRKPLASMRTAWKPDSTAGDVPPPPLPPCPLRTDCRRHPRPQ